MSSIRRVLSPKIYRGLEADMPTDLEEGDIYIATDQPNIYLFNKDGAILISQQQ